MLGLTQTNNLYAASMSDDMEDTSVSETDDYEAPESEKRNITEWLETIDADKEFHKSAFERMDEGMKLARGLQWENQSDTDDRYVGDFTRSVIRRRVSALYAKNPSIAVKRKEKMEFKYWDENFDSLNAAMQNPADPFNQQILSEVAQAASHRKYMDRMARTLEIVVKHQIAEQQPNFKRQMKKLLRRVDTTGVGYIKIDYIKDMDIKPDVEAQISDLQNRLASIRQLSDEIEEGEVAEDDAEAEQLRMMIHSLETQKYILRKEGIVFRFPKSKALIVDRNCTQLEGWVGARYIAEEFSLSGKDVKRIYGVDMDDDQKPSSSSKTSGRYSVMPKGKKGDGSESGNYDVYLIHDLNTGTVFTICRGCSEYLQAPEAPYIITEQFYPYYALTFNDEENEDCIFPMPTACLIKHQQREFNRSKEALRQHRIAMKPLYVSATGALSQKDKKNVATHEAHEMIELENLAEGQSVDTKIAMVKKHNIDPNVYETGSLFDDVNKIINMQPADLGGLSNATATETSVASEANQGALSSDMDDQDDFLSVVLREVGHCLLMHLEMDTVYKIAGQGAVWMEFPDESIISDIYIDIEAGSSGKPNRASEAAAMQRLYPVAMQTPGVKPEWMAKKIIKLLDENVDLTDAYLDGLPSIMSMNRQAQMGTGDPATDPNMQGGEGGDNAESLAAPENQNMAAMPMAGGATTEDQQMGGMSVINR